jgi:hypothetical protein
MAALDARSLGSELGMVDHYPDHHHQSCVAAVAIDQHEVRVEDGQDSAANAIDP